MAEYDNTNSGALFQNDRKTKNSHPDFKGQCTIKTPDGELVEFWVSGWEKTGRKGPFLSLAFTQKDGAGEREERPAAQKSSLFGKRSAEAAQPAQKTSEPDLDDSLPF